MKLKSLLHHLNLRQTRLLPKKSSFFKFFLITFFVFIFISLTKQIFAVAKVKSEIKPVNSIKIDTTNFIHTYTGKQDAIDGGSSQEAWINESLGSNSVSLTRAIMGDIKTDKTGTAWIPGGMIGMTNKSIAYLYNPTISGVQYIADTFNNFLGKPTYAANGFGFENINNFMDLWKTVRNTVYTLISLFFIILGIMIMLRVKISPQATVTVQVIIPKVITTLVLVTFSYAIAGLLFDLSYVVLGIVLNIFKSSISKSYKLGEYANNMEWLLQLNFWSAWEMARHLVPDQVMWFLALIIGAVVTVTTALAGGVVLGFLSGALVLFGIGFYCLLQVAKFFFGAAKCYFIIILKIIFAPIEIAAGVLPNSKVNFTSWIKGLVANLAVFPAGVIFLVLANIIIDQISSDNVLSLPLLGTGTLLDQDTIGVKATIAEAVLGIAALSIFSKIPQIVPQAFGIKSNLDKTLGDTFKSIPGVAAVTGGFRTLKEETIRNYTRTAGGLKNPFKRKVDSPGQTTTQDTKDAVPGTRPATTGTESPISSGQLNPDIWGPKVKSYKLSAGYIPKSGDYVPEHATPVAPKVPKNINFKLRHTASNPQPKPPENEVNSDDGEII